MSEIPFDESEEPVVDTRPETPRETPLEQQEELDPPADRQAEAAQMPYLADTPPLLGVNTECLGERTGGEEEPYRELPDDPTYEELAEEPEDAARAADNAGVDATEPRTAEHPTSTVETPALEPASAPPGYPDKPTSPGDTAETSPEATETLWYGVPIEDGARLVGQVRSWIENVDPSQGGLEEHRDTAIRGFFNMRVEYGDAPLIDELITHYTTEFLQRCGPAEEEHAFDILTTGCTLDGLTQAVVNTAYDSDPDTAPEVLDRYLAFTERWPTINELVREGIAPAIEARTNELNMLLDPPSELTVGEAWAAIGEHFEGRKTSEALRQEALYNEAIWGDIPAEQRERITNACHDDMQILNSLPEGYPPDTVTEVAARVMARLDEQQAALQADDALAFDGFRLGFAEQLLSLGHPAEALAMGRDIRDPHTQADFTESLLEAGARTEALQLALANPNPWVTADLLFRPTWGESLVPIRDMELAADSLTFQYQSDDPGLRAMQEIISDANADPIRRIACMQRILTIMVDSADNEQSARSSGAGPRDEHTPYNETTLRAIAERYNTEINRIREESGLNDEF